MINVCQASIIYQRTWNTDLYCERRSCYVTDSETHQTIWSGYITSCLHGHVCDGLTCLHIASLFARKECDHITHLADFKGCNQKLQNQSQNVCAYKVGTRVKLELECIQSHLCYFLLSQLSHIAGGRYMSRTLGRSCKVLCLL